MAISKYTFIGLAIGSIGFAASSGLGLTGAVGKPVTFGFSVILALAALLAVRYQQRRVHNIEQATAIIPLPVFGCIDRDFEAESVAEVLPGVQEIIRNVQSWLQEPGQEIVVLSADPEDGKSILSSGLAMSLSDSGKRVTLLDVNFRNPTISKMFAVPVSQGRSAHLVRKNLKVIPATFVNTSDGIFGDPAFAELTEERRAASDLVLYDCNATTDDGDALTLLNENSYVIIVVRLGHTMVRSLERLAVQISRKQIADGALVIFGSDCSDARYIQLTPASIYNA
jgi:Mrp family chromosome partitioning ATPase